MPRWLQAVELADTVETGVRVVFRADASVLIGSGHVMRCLTLADQLRQAGADVAFICRNLPGAMFDVLTARCYRFVGLFVEDAGKIPQQLDAEETLKATSQLFPDGVDWLVVDHYQLDVTWERLLRVHTLKLMVIDDLANRSHDCDLLLDQNYYREMERRYQGMVPQGCVTMLGPDYVLLRPEFAIARQGLRVRGGSVKRILIFFGGSDSTGQTRKALAAVKMIPLQDIAVDVVVGASNPYQDEIRTLCGEMPDAEYHCQVSNMAELIAKADLAVGAGGSAMWERCYLGLPTLTVICADNQQRTTEDVANLGAIDCIGRIDSLEVNDYAQAIAEMVANPQRRKQISDAALAVVPEQSTAAVMSAMWSVMLSHSKPSVAAHLL